MMRLFSSIIVAFAMFLSPVAMASGASMAMAHTTPAAVAGEAGHCSEEGLPSADGEMTMDLNCASACGAMIPASSRAYSSAESERTAPVRGGPQLLIGIQPEGETPPPRVTPEI
jgi:hypothetical protein